jgi:hypothetical protein
MWDLLANPEVVSGTFADRMPVSSGWRLVRMVCEPSDATYIVLEKEIGTAFVPKRWVSEQCDTYQMRLFLFGVSDVQVSGNMRNAICDLKIAKNSFELIQSKSALNAKVSCLGIRAEFFPYRKADYDAPPKWPG